MTTKLAEKLVRLFEEEKGLEFDPVIKRTYSGRHQVDAGAWKWFMTGKNGTIGSPDTAVNVSKAKKRSYWNPSSQDTEVCAEK